MAHFAQLDENNVVIEVNVISNSDCGGGEFPESEPIGQAFIASLGLTGVWLQTSYNGNFRGQFAQCGSRYLPETNEFVWRPPATEEQ